MVNKFKDIVESGYKLYEAKEPNVLKTLEFSWGESDKENKNHRTYPDKVFRPAVEALGFRIESTKVPGQSDHPILGGGTRLSDVSHILTKVWMDGNTAMARADLLKTDAGRNTLRVIESNVKIGASLRGFGEIDKDGKVKPGLEIKTVDLVVDPSFPIASIDQSNVIESFIPEEDGRNELDQIKLHKALLELSDATLDRIQEMLEKDGIKYSQDQIKALPLYLKQFEKNPKIGTFLEWFREQVEKFGGKTEGIVEAGNFRKSTILEEKKMAGSFSGYSSERQKRIEARQTEIDEALNGCKHDRQTISRFYAEAVEAGFMGDKKAFIEKYGF